MADTLSLDAAVSYILERGGSVRLIGDDQQLSAIGAGGVLRDIRATHGALQLTELVRFKDPAEGAASLALREGKREALGFYLDRDRVHVGDLATMTEDVFAAWQADRAAGLDSIMLAPTRDLVSELNQQARAHRLEGIDPADVASSGPVRRLADGNEASIGELIITRENDRRLRTSATDWVKNGDRWTVLEIHDGGDLTVQHTQHGRTVRLPADYVAKATELGYACTVHTAQGVTADTMHGLATGSESRQQLYTMMTRGAHANHVYLEVVGDGDPHSVIHPTLVRPLTPTDILESMLARDDAQRSATSLLREQADPATRLGEAAQRYLDSLYVAAEDLLRHETTSTGVDGTTVNVVDALDTAVETLAPGLSEEAAWPTLRAHLLLLGAAGENPVEALRAAAGDRELESARDRAAVLDWRLDASGLRNAGAGPLPWMPAIPARLAEDPHWGAYLSQRAHLVEQLAEQVRTRADRTGRAAGVGAERHPPRGRHGGRRRGLARSHAGPRRRPATDRRTAAAEGVRDLAAAPQPGRHRRPHAGAQGMAPAALLARPAGPRRRVHPAAGRAAGRDVARRRHRPRAAAHRRRARSPGRPAARRARRGRRCGGAWPATSRPRSPPRSATAPTARASPPTGLRGSRTCSVPSGPRASRPAPGGRRWSPTSTTACSAAGRSRPCWAPAGRCRATAGRASTSARRWSGGPRSRWRPLPTSTRTSTTSTSRPRTCGRASSPTRRRSSTTPDDIADWPLAEDPGPDLEPPVDLVDEHQVDALEERPGRRRRGPVRRARPDAGRLHPRPRRHPTGAHRRRHPAHVPARRRVALLPRHA